MVLFYFVFGILGPLVGISGFLSAPVAGRPGVSAIYYLFEARGGGFLFRYLDFQGIWLLLTGYGIVFLILGLFSAFAVFQWAYADYHLVKIKRNWQIIGLVIGIANILFEFFVVFKGNYIAPISHVKNDVAHLQIDRRDIQHRPFEY